MGLIQNNKKKIIIAKIGDDLHFIPEKSFPEFYDKNKDLINLFMYIKGERLRRFTKNAIKVYIEKLKKQ